jgi:hypothetical protein
VLWVALVVVAASAATLADAHLPARSHAVSPGGGFRDAARAPSRTYVSATTWLGGQTTAGTGETVTVYVSTSLAPELGTPRTWADYFAGLVHGAELSKLVAYVATYTEVQNLCGGGDAVGCYGGGQLATIGESLSWVDREDVASHEYGHHVAFNRDNSPWQAVAWGTKRWASLSNICARAAAGTVFPGDEAGRYRLNPGEGFAEAYRATNEAKNGASTFDWQLVDPSFYPDAAALQAVERDVLEPWSPSAKATAYRGRFAEGGKRTWTLTLPTPLDGQLLVTIRLPANKPYSLSLLAANRRTVLARGLWSAATQKSVNFTVCGQRSLVVRVTRVGPAGRFTVVVAGP